MMERSRTLWIDTVVFLCFVLCCVLCCVCVVIREMCSGSNINWFLNGPTIVFGMILKNILLRLEQNEIDCGGSQIELI